MVKAALVRRLGPNITWVGGGLIAFAGANFAFIALVARDLGPSGSAPVNLVWTVLNAIGIGLFQPLEQESSRSIAAARGLSTSGRAHLGYVLRYALAVYGALLVIGLVAIAPLSDLLFSGQRGLVVIVLLGMAGQAMGYFARGILAGIGKFARYGVQFGGDGLIRLVLAALLHFTGTGTQLRYGAVLVIAPVLATVVSITPSIIRSAVRLRRLPSDAVATGPRARRWPSLVMAPLVGYSLTSQLVANAGPIALSVITAGGQPALTGIFLAANSIARVPLFAFAAVQAIVLPALAGLATRADRPAFVRTLRVGFVATVGLGAAGVAAIALVGPQLLTLVYGDKYSIGRVDFTLLALSGAIFMVAQLFTQGLLALRADIATVIGWTVGLVGLLVALTVPLSPATRVATALCIGTACAAAVLAVELPRRIRCLTPTEDSTIIAPSI